MIEGIAEEYTQLLIANYLKSHKLDETLASFLKETSLSNTNLLAQDSLYSFKDENLITIIKERIEYNEYNLAEQIQSLKLNNENNSQIKFKLESSNIKQWNHNLKWSIINRVNLDSVILVSKFVNKGHNIALSLSNKKVIIYDRLLNEIKEQIQLKTVVKTLGSISSKSFNAINYICTMDGTLQIFISYKHFGQYIYKLHQRIITYIDFLPTFNNSQYNKNKDNIIEKYVIVSTGLDQLLKVSSLTIEKVSTQNKNHDFIIQIKEIDSLKLQSNCTSLKCCTKESELSIFLARNDFTNISCYSLNPKTSKLYIKYYLALNNTQFSTHSFIIRDIDIINNEILAVATSHIPYMRVILVEIPNNKENSKNSETCTELSNIKTYYDQILSNIATQISNNNLSQPVIKYCPIINGLLIGNDDGLFAMDLIKSESWSLQKMLQVSVKTTIKHIDILNDGEYILLTFSNKSICLYKVQ